MHVLLLAENWPPRVGGIEHYLSRIAGHLPKQSVTVVAPRTESGLPDASAPASGVRRVIRQRFFWPLIKPAWLPLFISLYRQVKREPVDVIICGKALFEGLIGYYLKRHLGIPYVVCTYAMEIATWQRSRRTRRQLVRVLRAADRVVYINDVTKQTLLELGVQPPQLVKLWPGIDDAQFNLPSTGASEPVLSKYHIQKPYVLTVARLVARKGIDQLIESFAALDQTKFGGVQLVIAGEGPERARLEELTRQSFIGSSVTFVGNVPDAEIRALHAQAAVFALTPRELPGDYEGFGIVYLEAAAAGVPAIATASGGAGEAVVNGHTGIVVPPDSLPAITQALATLLSNTALRHKLGRQAKQRAWTEFRWRKRILVMHGLLEAVIRENRERTR